MEESFLYCENIEEVNQSLDSILDENEWQDEKVLIIDERLEELFKDFNLKAQEKLLKVLIFYLLVNI